MRRLRRKFRLDHGHCGLAGRLDDAAYAIFGALPILSKALSRKAECWQSYNRTAEQPIEIEGATNPTSSFLRSFTESLPLFRGRIVRQHLRRAGEQDRHRARKHRMRYELAEPRQKVFCREVKVPSG
jgi:hypothetical protein